MTTYNIQFSALVPVNILVEAEEGLTQKELLSRVTKQDLLTSYQDAEFRYEDLDFSWKQDELREGVFCEDEEGNTIN